MAGKKNIKSKNEEKPKSIHPRLLDFFRQNGLIVDDSKNSITYSRQSNPASRLDVSRFIRDQPYWANQTLQKTPKPKKIILNYWQLLTNNHAKLKELWDFLYSQGFEIYFSDKDKKLKQVREFVDLRTLYPDILNLQPNEDLKKDLSLAGHDVNQYCFLDHKELAKLVNETNSLGLTEIRYPLLLNEKLISVDENGIDEFLKLLKSSLGKQFGEIRFSCKTENHFYTFYWKNDFTPEELEKLFLGLKDKKINEVLSEASRKNLTHFIDCGQNQEEKKIDVSFFENLTLLGAQGFLNIQGISNLKNLESLSIEDVGKKSDEREVIIDLVGLKKLKNFKNIKNNVGVVVHNDLEEFTSAGDVTARKNKALKKLTLNLKGETSYIFPQIELTKLENLTINGGFTKTPLDLIKFPNIKKLTLNDCIFGDIKNLDACKDLEEVSISLPLDDAKSKNPDWLQTMLQSLNNLPKLKKLTLSGFDNMNYLDIYDLKNLKELELNNLKNMFALIGSEESRLEKVSIKNLNKIDSMCFRDSNKLKVLSISNCEELKEIQGLQECPSLLSIQVKEVPKLKTILTDYDVPRVKDDLNLIEIKKTVERISEFTKSLNSKTSFDDKPTLEKVLKDLEKDDKISLKDYFEKLVKKENVFHDLPIYINRTLNLKNDDKKEVPKKIAFDADTYSKGVTFNLVKIFSSQSQLDPEPHVAHYRKELFYSIDVDNLDQISLVGGSFEFKPIQIADKKVANEKGVYNASLPGPFFPGQEFILPGLSSKDELLMISDKDLIEISFSENTGQYKVRIKSNSPRSLLSFDYTIKPSNDYFFAKLSSNKELKEDVTTYPLPEKLQTRIKECLQLKNTYNDSIKPSQKFLEFVKTVKEAKETHEILNAIISFCKKFDNEPLTIKTDNPMNDFLSTIWEAKGSCRHRSRAFLALCQYYGLPARLNGNGCHIFPEVSIDSPSGLIWKGIDLGGVDAAINYEKSPLVKSVTDKKDEKIPMINAERYHKDFLASSQWLNDCKTVSNVIDGLFKLPKSPLIRYTNTQDAWLWHSAIHAHQITDTIYIDSVEELHLAFAINQVKNNEVKLIDGPLKELIGKGNGTIIINWTNFSANEKAIFKSLIDDPPTLNGIIIPPTIKVIGLLGEKEQANDVFLSRCNEIRVPENIVLPRVANLGQATPYVMPPSGDFAAAGIQELQEHPDEKLLADTKTTSINLYHDRDWMQYLVESIKIDQDNLLSQQGILVHCMLNGLPLIIKNPPQDNPDFKLFWHKLTTENSLLVNGTKIQPKTGFKVIFKEEPLLSNNPLNFIFDGEVDPLSRKLYISDGNFNQLFTTQQVTPQGKVISNSPGLLESYKKGDQIIINKNLSNDQVQRIQDTINSLKKQNPQLPDIHFCLQSIPSEPEKYSEFLKNPSYHIESNDPLLMLNAISKDVKSDNIFYTTNENNWANFFEDIQLIKRNGKIVAERKEQSLWEKLKKGETVILVGDLKPEEYAAIKTLFLWPPYLYINGVRETNIKGTLKWISKPQLELNTNEIPTQQLNINFSQYSKILQKDIKNSNQTTLNNLDMFLTTALNLTSKNPHFPDLSKITYEKYKSLYHYADGKSTQENPIKPIFQYYYKKGTPEYAYLNVIGKFYLSSSKADYVRLEKLSKILPQLNSYEEFKKVFWQAINCFSAKAIHEFMPNLEISTNNTIPFPSEDDMKKIWEKMLEKLSKEMNNKVFLKPKGNKRFEKQQSRLAASLSEPDKRLTFLLGPAGTGKTFTAKRVVKKANLFEGENKIKAWLEAKSDQAVLLLDEANLEESGKWEFLRGLMKVPPTITYQNKTHVLGPQHRVIVTGNPSDYPGRHWHQVFWEKAHVIWFAPFQPHFIKEKVREFMQAPDSPALEKISKLICEAYEYLSQHPQRIAEITLRDIENICARLQTTHYSIGRVILDEMAGVLASEEDRAQFKAHLESLSEIIPEHKLDKKPKEIIVPDDFHSAWVMLQDDLKMRAERIKAGSNTLPGRSGTNKLGTLLEGASGIGKSTLITAALKELGLDLKSNDTQKRYYQITVGSLNVTEILLKAFHKGSVVILDELNLNQDVEKILNQLLSGFDNEGNAAKKAGFTVLATQNPPHYSGTKIASTALTSRFHKIPMKNLTQQSVEKYAEAEGHPEPKVFAQAYQDMQKKHPFINARHMFYAVKQYKKEGVKYSFSGGFLNNNNGVRRKS